jgi:hypothetical protein
MLHLDRCHVEQHVALSHLMAEWRVTWAADGNALQIASRVRRRAAPSRRASACRESACRAVCACRARRWCAAAPATTDRNARAGPCRMLGPGAQRRPPVIVYTCFEKSSRSPYCTREPRRRAHCVILIYIITRLLRGSLCVAPPAAHCAHNKRLYGFIIYRSPRTPQARPLHLFGLLSRAGCTKTYPRRRVFTPRTISHGPDLEQNEHRGARTTPVSTARSRPSYARRYGALGLR